MPRHSFEVIINPAAEAPSAEVLAYARAEFAKFNADHVGDGGDPLIVLRARVRPVSDDARRAAEEVVRALQAAAKHLAALRVLDSALAELVDERLEVNGLSHLNDDVEATVDALVENIEQTFDAIDADDAMTAARAVKS